MSPLYCGPHPDNSETCPCQVDVGVPKHFTSGSDLLSRDYVATRKRAMCEVQNVRSQSMTDCLLQNYTESSLASLVAPLLQFLVRQSPSQYHRQVPACLWLYLSLSLSLLARCHQCPRSNKDLEPLYLKRTQFYTYDTRPWPSGNKSIHYIFLFLKG